MLEIARTLRADTITAAAAITMAQKSQLEGRLLAVLDAARNRGRVTKTLFVASAISAITILALLSSLDVARSESEVGTFELHYSAGYTATLIGVTDGTVEYPEFAWGPNGAPLPAVPESNGTSGWASPQEGKINRRFYIEVRKHDEGAVGADIGVKLRVDSKTGGSPSFTAGPNTSPVLAATFDENSESVGFELGIASGAWQEAAKDTFGNSSAGKVGETFYSILVTQIYTRNGETRFSVTHSVKDRQWRVVLFDKGNTMHKPNQNDSNGVEGMTQAEFVLDDIAPEDVARVELQVRDYEWRKFEGIAVNPDDNRSTQKTAHSLDGTKSPTAANSAIHIPASLNPPEDDTADATSPFSLTRNAGRVEARSEDGRVVLIKTAQSLLRIDAPNIRIENRSDDQITIHADGYVEDRPSVGVLMGSNGLNIQRLDAIHRIAAQRPAIDTRYIVQRGWDKALVALPTPILVPEAMTRTEEWRNWQQTKDVRKLEYMDELGRKYFLHGWGWAKSGIKLFPIIPRLERFRPDGTLEGWTSFHEEMPEATHFYEADGVTPAGRVLLRVTGIEGAPHVRNYTWRDSAGQYHQYDITPNGIIQYESLGTMVDGQGFDMDSFINQVKDGESMQVSFEADDVVRRIEIAGRADAPEKSLSTEVSVDPGTQKDRSPNAKELVDERTVWGEVHNGLQAAIHIEPREGGYPADEPIDVTVLLRNVSSKTIELVSSGFVDVMEAYVYDASGNRKIPGFASAGEGDFQPRRLRLEPGEVVASKKSKISFVSLSTTPSTHTKRKYLTIRPGPHTVHIEAQFVHDPYPFGIVSSLPDDWTGTLKTGEMQILIAQGNLPQKLEVRWVAADTDLGVSTLVPWRVESRPENEPAALSLQEEVLWSDADIAALEVVQGPVAEEFALKFQLTSEAGTRWEKATETSIGKRLALVLDGEVIYATTLNGAISGGVMLLTGSFDRAEADSLANAIRAANPGIASELKASGEGATLGPEIEVIVRHAGENCMIDFDTGKLFTPPDFNGTEDAFAWCETNGIDAGGGNQDEVRGLIGMDLVLNPEANEVWDDAETNGALNHDAFKYGTPGNPVYLSAKGELPATWTFKTREGGRGIVQILGFEDDEPRGVKIRYRMME